MFLSTARLTMIPGSDSEQAIGTTIGTSTRMARRIPAMTLLVTLALTDGLLCLGSDI
jgi:hypothetical protein